MSFVYFLDFTYIINIFLLYTLTRGTYARLIFELTFRVEEVWEMVEVVTVSRTDNWSPVTGLSHVGLRNDVRLRPVLLGRFSPTLSFL